MLMLNWALGKLYKLYTNYKMFAEPSELATVEGKMWRGSLPPGPVAAEGYLRGDQGRRQQPRHHHASTSVQTNWYLRHDKW